MRRLRLLIFWIGLIGLCSYARAQTEPSEADAEKLVREMIAQVSAIQAKLTAKSAYEPAAKSLALLCESDPFYFLDEPPYRPAWTPPGILKLGPTWVEIAPDAAHVEFGGGFEHFGYSLQLDKSAANDGQNHWKLIFYDDAAADKPLMSFATSKADHVDRSEFIRGALDEFRRRAAGPAASNRDVADRIVFLLKFDEVDMARVSIRQCAAVNPSDWLDQMLAFIIDSKTDPGAASRLDAWAAKMGDFSAWLFAAYAYDAVGNFDAAERCIKSATTKPADDPEWCGYNARFRGAAMCAQLLQARRYATCATLCDALLAYTGSGSYLVPQISSIRDFARRGVPTPPAFEEGTAFEPFKGLDLARLTVVSATTAASGLAAPRSSDYRLLQYYDHCIAANPQDRRNYTRKFVFLLSLNRRSDAVAALKAAGQIFPDWWRPPVALAFLADGDSRAQAEANLRQWVKAYPAFIHWWYLSQYYRDHGDNDRAIAAVQEAVKYPLQEVDEDETWVPAAYAFDAAAFAYRQKKFELVLDIARVWSKPRGVYNYFDDDIYAFRAAAELALGDFAKAKVDADAAADAAAKHALWTTHLPELQNAVNAHNINFLYDPGNMCGGDWTYLPAE